MADTRIQTREHDEIQELSKEEMEDVTGGGVQYECQVSDVRFSGEDAGRTALGRV